MDFNESQTNPLVIITNFMIQIVLLVLVYYKIKEKIRLMVILFEKVIDNEFDCSKKMKLLISISLLCINATIGMMIVSTSFDLMVMSTNSIDLINDSLSVLVLIDIDQMLSILYSNWITTYYNKLIQLSNFMQAKSTAKIETTLFTWTISFCMMMISYLILFYYDRPNSLKRFAEKGSNKSDQDIFLTDLYFWFPYSLLAILIFSMVSFAIHYCFVFKCVCIRKQNTDPKNNSEQRDEVVEKYLENKRIIVQDSN